MPDRDTIARVAKILARAGSDNANEAAQALQGAYKRMVRDSVSLRDLLSLPLEDLYQDTLVKLIDVILNDQPNLSPSARREAYSEYMLMIVARFSGAWDGQPNDSGSSGSTQSGQSASREEEARQYEERRRQQEAERGRGGASSPPSPPPGQQDGAFNRSSDKTSKHTNAKTYPFKVGQFTFSFSLAAFFSALGVLFGRGSITWHALHQPGLALRLFAVSLLYGLGFAGVVLVAAGVFHGLTGTGPLWDIKLKNAIAFLAAVGFLFKCRQLYVMGWF